MLYAFHMVLEAIFLLKLPNGTVLYFKIYEKNMFMLLRERVFICYVLLKNIKEVHLLNHQHYFLS